MMKKIVIAIFLLTAILSAQTRDSILIKTQGKAIAADTLKLKDTTAVKKDSLHLKAEIINPIYPHAISEITDYKNILDRETLKLNDYRYTGDYFKRFPLGFLRDLGSLGQPAELLLYGAGFDETSYLNDGQSLNNRLTNSFDLNNIQSESIDSVEILPATRGFLYGLSNNPVAVNFIPREQFGIGKSKAPYTRIRYYQAPDEEAMIDFIYNSYLLRRLIVTLDITNKTINSRLPNSSFGIWNGTARLKYLLSQNYDLTGTYRYTKSTASLNGGINIDSSKGLSELPENQPVNYYDRYQKLTSNNYSIRLSNRFENFYGNVNAYYYSNLIEFRQGNKIDAQSVPFIFHDNSDKTYGITAMQDLNEKYFSINANAGMERSEFNAELLTKQYNINSAMVSSKLDLKILGNNFIPSVFGKYLRQSGKSYEGYGAEITSSKIRAFQFYLGASHFTKPLNIIQQDFYSTNNTGQFIPGEQSVNTLEISVGLYRKFLDMGITFFDREFNNKAEQSMAGSSNKLDGYVYSKASTSGIGLKLNFNLWRIFFESNSAYYSTDGGYLNTLPDLTFNGGLYYRDTLFNANLHLKTGFYLQYTGSQQNSIYTYDFERSSKYFWGGLTPQMVSQIPSIKPSLQLDFTLIGEIQQRAILYFTLENILGENYYVVPYYLKQGRGMRLGFSWEFLN